MITTIFIVSILVTMGYFVYKFDRQKALNDEKIGRNKQDYLREQIK